MMDLARELWWLYLVVIAAAAWVAFAEHPTAANLRRAISDSIDL